MNHVAWFDTGTKCEAAESDELSGGLCRDDLAGKDRPMGLIVRRNQPDTPWFRLTEAAWHARVRGQDCYLVFDPEAAFWWMLREGVVVGGSGDREDAMTLADD